MFVCPSALYTQRDYKLLYYSYYIYIIAIIATDTTPSGRFYPVWIAYKVSPRAQVLLAWVQLVVLLRND